MSVMQSVPVTFTFTVVSVLNVDSFTAPDVVAGQPYSLNLAQFVHGGKTPYTFAVKTGTTLPSGMSVSTDGVFSGTPDVAGNYNVQIVVNDSGN